MLTIRVVSFKGQQAAVPIERAFGPEGGSIGREPTNRLILPDPERLVSRTHAQVSHENGAYRLTDTGSNPITVNGRAVGKGAGVWLQNGDRIRIGEYELAVDFDEGYTQWNPAGDKGAPVHGAVFGEKAREANWNMPAAETPRAAEPLLDALREGMGLPGQELSPETMRRIGRLLRESLDGVVGLLRARMQVKQDLQAEVTVLASRRNNPLKFSRDGKLALAQLLAPPLRGFMPAEEAVRDACDDLNSHLFGVMAGMHAAVDGLFKRFTPEELEKQLGRHVMLDLLPMHRKARLWETFLARQEEITAAATKDFQAVFGREFLNAYEARIRELEGEAAHERGGGR